MAQTGRMKSRDKGWAVLKKDLDQRIRNARKELARLEPLRMKYALMFPQPERELRDLDAQIKIQRDRISLWTELRENAVLLTQVPNKKSRVSNVMPAAAALDASSEGPQQTELQMSLAELADSPIFGMADTAVPVFEQLAG